MNFYRYQIKDSPTWVKIINASTQDQTLCLEYYTLDFLNIPPGSHKICFCSPPIKQVLSTVNLWNADVGIYISSSATNHPSVQLYKLGMEPNCYAFIRTMFTPNTTPDTTSLYRHVQFNNLLQALQLGLTETTPLFLSIKVSENEFSSESVKTCICNTQITQK